MLLTLFFIDLSTQYIRTKVLPGKCGLVYTNLRFASLYLFLMFYMVNFTPCFSPIAISPILVVVQAFKRQENNVTYYYER